MVLEYLLIFDGYIAESYFTYVNSTTPHFAYDINETGWYSYKIVVKQQEQDYYNVYTPGILAGYPGQVPETTNTVTNPILPAPPATPPATSVKWVITDANDLINQILDVLEIENPELYTKTIEQYQDTHMKDLVSTLDKHIQELDDFDDEQILELLTNIVGDA